MNRFLQILVMSVLFCFIAMPAYAESSIQSENNYDVRKIRWGMTREEVKKSESAKFIAEKDGNLFYWERIINQDCDIVFKFEDNKLQ